MAHFTSNPLHDSVEHIIEQDRKQHDFDHKCDWCEQGFDYGHGVRISDEKFCSICIDSFKHFDFYRNAGLNDREIYEVTSQIEVL